MQLRSVVLAIACACIGSAACAFLPGDVTLSPGARDCSSVEGLKNLHVYIWTADRWRKFVVQGATVVLAPPGEPAAGSEFLRNNSRRNYFDFEGAEFDKTFAPEKHGLSKTERLGFPAAYSRDTRKFVAAVIAVDPSGSLVSNGEAARTPKQLMLRYDAETRRLNSLAGFSIYALAWSPDSTRIAVVERNYDNTARSPIAALTPHGVSYSDVVVSVYTATGTMVCQSLIVPKIPDASVAVDWSEN